MKKRIVALLLALCMVLALAACGGGGDSTQTQAPATQAPATEAPSDDTPMDFHTSDSTAIHQYLSASKRMFFPSFSTGSISSTNSPGFTAAVEALPPERRAS